MERGREEGGGEISRRKSGLTVMGRRGEGRKLSGGGRRNSYVILSHPRAVRLVWFRCADSRGETKAEEERKSRVEIKVSLTLNLNPSSPPPHEWYYFVRHSVVLILLPRCCFNKTSASVSTDGDLIARNFFNPIKSESLSRRNVEWGREGSRS